MVSWCADVRVPQVSPSLRDLGAVATMLPLEPCKLRTNPNLNARTRVDKIDVGPR